MTESTPSTPVSDKFRSVVETILGPYKQFIESLQGDCKTSHASLAQLAVVTAWVHAKLETDSQGRADATESFACDACGFKATVTVYRAGDTLTRSSVQLSSPRNN